MSLKTDMLDHKNCAYIMDFDFFKSLGMTEAAMLAYLIDLDDYKRANCEWMEVTPKYVHIKRKGWTTHTIRTALKKLEADGYIEKKPINNGRGNYYRLNREKIMAIADDYQRFDDDDE